MPRLRILPQDRTISLQPDETVLDALSRAGIAIDSECNGQGLCGKCTVLIGQTAEVPPTPHPRISAEEEAEGIRLACRIQPHGDMDITLRETEQKAETSDWILGGEGLRLGTILPAVSRSSLNGRTSVLHRAGPEADGLPWPADRPLLGAALDVGTTTLVAAVYDLDSGREIGTACGLNPQRRYGGDVLRRIQRGSTPEGLRELAGLARNRLNELLGSVLEQAGLPRDSLLDITIGGNTTMLQLLAAIDPAPLGRSPFHHSLQGGRSYPVENFGLAANQQARVYLPPIIHAYAGTDLSAGLQAVDFFAASSPRLFMDIGTNGEMALGTGYGDVLVASTAAGPAFEGGGLHSGMGAAAGAVEQVWLDRGRLRFSTLGNETARGICGSGLVDLIACLLRLGLLEPSGRLLRPGKAPELPRGSRGQISELDGQAAFRLQDDVLLTQSDIRSFQLAKSAVRTGLDLLLARGGITAGEVEAVTLAGGFGRALRPANLEAVGILPPGCAGRLRFAGNTSLAGSALLLLDIEARRRLEEAVGRIEYVRLAREEAFMELFVQNMEFPEPSAEPAVAGRSGNGR